MAARQFGSGVTEVDQRVGSLPPPRASVRLAGRPIAAVGTARIYVCGITPYDVTHLGHAATFVWADLLARQVRATGVEVSVCRNITDVDDVLLDAARARGRHYDEFALGQEAVFAASMRELGVATPHAEPHARHHIDATVQLAEVLLASGAAYEREGTVWFRGAQAAASFGLSQSEALRLFAEYGEQPDHPAKEDPFDVAVWQASEPGVPAWPSPWGWGRPGWHAECAAMALAVHGPALDVLAGGVDLAFPHHAYQSAMAEAASGVRPFARAHLHVGEVRIAGAKMAKSTGNLVLVDELLATHPAAVLRLLILDRPHDRAWEFRADDLDAAAARLDKLYQAAGRPGSAPADAAVARLRDGLDVPAAIDLALGAEGETARALIAALGLG